MDNVELTAEELQKISDRLCNLATECHFMYDEAKFASRMVGVYSTSSYQVVNRLQGVLRRADNLLDELHFVSASLDDILIRHKVLDDAEAI